jgi:glutaredoxin
MFAEGLFRFASRWRRRGKASSRQLHFLLYTRQGCHLCEVAWQQLQAAQRRRSFTLEVVDVDSDPELVSQYGSRVPVVLVNGKLRFFGRINPVLLERFLQAAMR